MVWEQHVYLIVMVAREIENNIIKCAIYWPTDEAIVYELDLPSQFNDDRKQRKLELILKNISHPTENIIKRVFQVTEVEQDKVENSKYFFFFFLNFFLFYFNNYYNCSNNIIIFLLLFSIL